MKFIGIAPIKTNNVRRNPPNTNRPGIRPLLQNHNNNIPKAVKRKHINDYHEFHAKKIYGTGGKDFPSVLPQILALSPNSIIDYGAGRSDISLWLGKSAGAARAERFDPAVPGIDKIPEGRFDVVTSFDVLEHIPEDELDSVLSEMAAVGRDALLVIDIAPAKAILSDGRNAHVTLHDEAWWHERLAKYFPTIRPFKIRRPHRVAFRTWEKEFPAWQRNLIELKAKAGRKWHRWFTP
jgi:hypothetical protein